MAEIIKKNEIDSILLLSPKNGKNMIYKSSKMPFGILEDHHVASDAEVHKTEGDLWYSLEGEAHFICGGELVEPWFIKDKDGKENLNELKAKSIKNGTSIILNPGDWLWVPAGEPHQHSCEKTARLAVIKIPKTL